MSLQNLLFIISMNNNPTALLTGGNQPQNNSTTQNNTTEPNEEVDQEDKVVNGERQIWFKNGRKKVSVKQLKAVANGMWDVYKMLHFDDRWLPDKDYWSEEWCHGFNQGTIKILEKSVVPTTHLELTKQIPETKVPELIKKLLDSTHGKKLLPKDVTILDRPFVVGLCW